MFVCLENAREAVVSPQSHGHAHPQMLRALNGGARHVSQQILLTLERLEPKVVQEIVPLVVDCGVEVWSVSLHGLEKGCGQVLHGLSRLGIRLAGDVLHGGLKGGSRVFLMIGYNDAGRERAVVEVDGEERNGELRGEFIEGGRVNAVMDARQRALRNEGWIDV